MTRLIIEKLLVAVDFSEYSDIALEQAVQIAARGQDVEVVLLWVDTRLPSEGLAIEETLVSAPREPEASAAAHAETRMKLDELAERVRERGVLASTRVENGHADEVIVDVAHQIGAALVVVGTHGRTGFKRFLLGSVAEKVVRTCLTNVLVARHDGAPFSRVLVAMDFSPASEHALQMALALAAPGAQIDIVHAWQYPPGTRGLLSPNPPDGPFAELGRDIVKRVERLGNALVQRYRGPDRTLEFEAVLGAAAEVLHRRLEGGGYQLAAMGTHGHRGFRRFLLGSVAEATVRHAPCSVLVTHDLAQQQADRGEDQGPA